MYSTTVTTISGNTPFFVSPARHDEAQDMSGNLKTYKTKHNKDKQ
jgi:hypothetical protein